VGPRREAVTPSGGVPIGVCVENTKSVNNAFGIRLLVPNVTVRVGGSIRRHRQQHWPDFSGGGALLTAGNNMVQHGALSGPAGLQQGKENL
jgi:hypothetical protein